jgi:hypothetical protein
MQVRAYNHWASLLGEGEFPDIAELKPADLDDFGPYGVLLDFRGKNGIHDPAIAFLGAELARECGGEAHYRRLSEVPGRSLLSRITDHYLQILANQAPIGFEAEFTNQRGAEILYRGILLPWSSDGRTIDFVFGVINWKEVADAATADALLCAIDAALEAPIPPYQGKDMDRMLDLTGFAASGDDDAAPVRLPAPTFGASSDADEPLDLSVEALEEDEEGNEDEDEDEDGGATEWGAGFSGFGEEDTVYTVDYGALGLEDGEEEEGEFDGVVDPLADQSATLGLVSLVSRSGRVKQSVVLPGAGSEPSSLPPTPVAPIPQAYEPAEPAAELPRASAYAPAPEEPAEEPLELDAACEVDAGAGEPMLESAEAAGPATPYALDYEAVTTPGEEEPEGLYDCLAMARELAQTARSSEDRGRKALYQAVARAYDFSIEAAANPDDFAELLAENGLTVQDRAPMTPVVKLVFGADYDKTRLTEYATVLGYAHRTGVARGTLDKVLASAEGGLKGIVLAERRARKEAEGKPVAADAVRASLAKKLRKLAPISLDDLDPEGAEFALVMVRRMPDGALAVLGEVPQDVPFVEKAARRLLR